MLRKRIEWLDFAKGFTIFFVVLLHSLGSIHFNPNFFTQQIIRTVLYVIQLFVMPVFFAVSGYLYKPTNTFHKYKVMLYKKIMGFMIPYLLFNLLVVFLQHIHNIHSLVNIIITKWYGLFIFPSSWLWFLYVLFFIFLIAGTLDLFKVSFVLQLILSIILIFFVNINDPFTSIVQKETHILNPTLGGYYLAKGVFGYLICFYIGSLIHRFHWDTKVLNRKYLSYVLFIIWFALISIQHVSGDANMLNYENIDIKLFSIIVFFTIYINFRHNKIFSYFTKYGKYTLVVYLVHYPVITLIIPAVFKRLGITNILMLSPIVSLIIYFFISWIISIFACKLLQKSNIVCFLFYPRKYMDKLVLKK